MVDRLQEPADETPEVGYLTYVRALLMGDGRTAATRLTASAQASAILRHEVQCGPIPDYVPDDQACAFAARYRHHQGGYRRLGGQPLHPPSRPWTETVFLRLLQKFRSPNDHPTTLRPSEWRA